ncbi:hypothetical protein JCM6882_008155 [Rhodosporidiobolus microsporus]
MASLPTLPTVRISQRGSTSCSECSRRKTRCDKEIPCGNCRKRGKAHLCHIVPHIRPKDAQKLRESIGTSAPTLVVEERETSPTANGATSSGSTRNAPQIAHQPPSTLEGLALLAFSEVEGLRSTIEGLRSKVTGLESLLIAAFSKLKEDPERVSAAEAALQQQYQHQAEQPKAEEVSPDVPYGGGQPLPYAPHPSFAGDIFVNPHPPLPSTSHSLPHVPPPPPLHQSRPPTTASSPSLSPFQPGSAPSTTFTLPPMDPHGMAAAGKFELSPYGPPPVSMPGDESGLSEKNGADSGDDLREEEVAASLSLEFMIHANPFDGAPLAPSLVFDLGPQAPHPSHRFPTTASLSVLLLPYTETQVILEHALSWSGWAHGAIHAPTFRAEVQEFWGHPEETRFEQASAAWLSLLFAQMCVGVKHMASEQLSSLGWTEEESRNFAKSCLDAAVACLYRSHFLENHQLHAIQAIAVIVVTCQDGAFSNLFPMLLSLGISLAQDMGLHRLPSEEAWQASVAGQSLEQRARSLIAYETRKRVFWALTTQDWMNIPYRRTTQVQPTQVTTPLPANAHDEDLMTGVLINRPPSEYTYVSKALIWVQVARILQQVFEHIDNQPNPSYDYVLELDGQLQQLLSSVPAWLTSDVPAPHLPPNASWMRTAFAISSNHKVLTLHRAFFRRFEPSRRRAMDASRAILRESARIGDSRMWTVYYHISAAASVVCLDLFQRGSSPVVLHEERQEVLTALSTLRLCSSFSAIAARGAALIDNLLTEESRLPPIPPLSQEDEHDRAAKRRRVEDDIASSLPAPTPLKHDGISVSAGGGGPASLSNLLASPSVAPGLLPNGLVFGSGAGGESPTGAGPSRGLADSPFALGTPFGQGVGVGVDGGMSAPNGLGLVEELPPSFLHAFLDSGFDPLDGAITSPAPGHPWVEGE